MIVCCVKYGVIGNSLGCGDRFEVQKLEQHEQDRCPQETLTMVSVVIC